MASSVLKIEFRGSIKAAAGRNWIGQGLRRDQGRLEAALEPTELCRYGSVYHRNIKRSRSKELESRRTHTTTSQN